MRRIIAQTRKELIQIVRDYRTLGLALVLPLVLLLLLGSAISLTVTDVPIVVQDLDDSPASRASSMPFALRSRFMSSPGPPIVSRKRPSPRTTRAPRW